MQVFVDPEAQTVVWPNGADFDPATLSTGRATSRRGVSELNAGGSRRLGDEPLRSAGKQAPGAAVRRTTATTEAASTNRLV
jgi:hypothetical protein